MVARVGYRKRTENGGEETMKVDLCKFYCEGCKISMDQLLKHDLEIGKSVFCTDGTITFWCQDCVELSKEAFFTRLENFNMYKIAALEARVAELEDRHKKN